MPLLSDQDVGIPAMPAMGTQIVDPQGGSDLHGPAYLDYIAKTVSPSFANTVKAVAEGREPFPSGFASKTPRGAALQDAVGQYEPGFTAQTFQQRQKAYNDWYGGGKTQQALRALDQGLNHALEITHNVDQLGNWGLGAVVNKPVNEAESLVGMETGYNPLSTNAHAVADEFGKVWKGAGLSDAEIRAWSDAFRVNGSIPQQKADVLKLMGLLKGAIGSYQDMHQTSFGPNATNLPPVVSPGIQAKMDAIENWAKGNPSPQARSAPPTGGLPPGWTVQVH